MPIATCATCGYQLLGTSEERGRTRWSFNNNYARTCAVIQDEPEDSEARKKAMAHECPNLWEAMAEAATLGG